MDGHDVTRHLREQAADTYLEMVLKLGARGYFLKEEAQELVIQAIHYVHCGGILVSPLMAEKIYVERAQSTPTKTAMPEPPDDAGDDDNANTMRLSELEMDMPVAEVEFVITVPAETSVVLGFHEWLTYELGGDVRKVDPSLVGDTVITVF